MGSPVLDLLDLPSRTRELFTQIFRTNAGQPKDLSLFKIFFTGKSFTEAFVLKGEIFGYYQRGFFVCLFLSKIPSENN